MSSTTMPEKIRINQPLIEDDDIAAVKDCIEDGQISGNAPIIEDFEKEFAAFIGRKHAIYVANGTIAANLIVRSLFDLYFGSARHISRRGMRLNVPSISMATPTLAAHDFLKGTVISHDVNINTFCSEGFRNIGAYDFTMIIHPYGVMRDPIIINGNKGNHENRLSDKLIIEDFSEAIGSFDKNGVKAGTIGNVSFCSLYANKTITSGEGAMIFTDDDDVYEKIQFFKDCAFGFDDKFMHPEISFNYRGSSLNAALGLSQLRKIFKLIDVRNNCREEYIRRLNGSVKFQEDYSGSRTAWWMVCIMAESEFDRDRIINALIARNIDFRKVFPPIEWIPAIRDVSVEYKSNVNSRTIHSTAINLPTGHGIDIERVSDAILSVF